MVVAAVKRRASAHRPRAGPGTVRLPSRTFTVAEFLRQAVAAGDSYEG